MASSSDPSALQPPSSSTSSIYKQSRAIKKLHNSLYNALLSIHHDAVFVSEISNLWPSLPLVANLRCGLWYSSGFDSTCYFKSTDGHTNNLSFSTARLNLHVAEIAGQRGGCIIVDSTRKGKRFPDSMSKTIPIWACVLNRAIKKQRKLCNGHENACNTELLDWDDSLHLPLWVSKTERAAIERCLEGWTEQFESTGADLDSIVSSLKKPLRPMWISQRTVIWLNEVPDVESWDFTPIILVSASSPTGIVRQTSISEFSWCYIPGAGDDEESWSRGLYPQLFWEHVFDIISWGPYLCNQKIADLVEKDRVYRSQRGENIPQIKFKSKKSVDCQTIISANPITDINCNPMDFNPNSRAEVKSCQQGPKVFWIGTTNLAVGATSHVDNVMEDIECVINCESKSDLSSYGDSRLHLPILTSKLDRSSLLKNLHLALNFAKLQLNIGKKLIICCESGEDISVCVCLAILASLFDESGGFDDGKTFSESCISKWEQRKRLVFICKYAASARPSRGNLKQVYSFLTTEKERKLS